MIEISTEPIQLRTLSDQWDAWRDAHGIPEPILEMYRRHGDKPGFCCADCDFLDDGVRNPEECDDYDARCEVISCETCPLHVDEAHPAVCTQYKGQVVWDQTWTACGAYRVDGEEDESCD